MNSPPKIVLERLRKEYLDLYTGEITEAVRSIDLEVGEGEFLALLGPSGCGKSTILNLIAGFIPLTSGRILLNGRPVQKPGADRGMVFQSFALFAWKTVLQNVAFGLKMRGLPKAEREAEAKRYIAMVGLDGYENRYPHELSGGMQQRVGVARALANKPEVLLMDEPFGSVDAQTRMILQEELTQVLDKERSTVLFVTHDVQEAVFLADRVAVISERPAMIKEIVHIPFDRPRMWFELRRDSRFDAIVKEILGKLMASPEAVRYASGAGFATSGVRLRASIRGEILTLIVLMGLWGGWHVGEDMTAQHKYSKSFREELKAKDVLDCVVHLRFPPEQFHLRVLQPFGSMERVDKERVIMHQVSRDKISQIARLHWVKSVTLKGEPTYTGT